MAPLIATAVKAVILKKAKRSITTWIGGVVAAGGAAATVDPDMLQAIPENLRGPAMALVGVLVVLARHRKEITALWNELRAAVKAGEPPAQL